MESISSKNTHESPYHQQLTKIRPKTEKHSLVPVLMSINARVGVCTFVPPFVAREIDVLPVRM
jgi:hypothetical protein